MPEHLLYEARGMGWDPMISASCNWPHMVCSLYIIRINSKYWTGTLLSNLITNPLIVPYHMRFLWFNLDSSFRSTKKLLFSHLQLYKSFLLRVQSVILWNALSTTTRISTNRTTFKTIFRKLLQGELAVQSQC